MPAAGAVKCPADMGGCSVRGDRMGYFIVTVTAQALLEKRWEAFVYSFEEWRTMHLAIAESNVRESSYEKVDTR